jgi:hypothetical protein
MKAPFPYFGGKSSVAPIVWPALPAAAIDGPVLSRGQKQNP